MNTEEGVIIETDDRSAKVRVGRHENCTACGACASAKNVILEANNDIGAKVGDRVKFTLPKENIILGAFMVFVFPLLFAGLGAVISYYCITEYIIETSALFFLISLLFVKMYDTKKGKELSAKARIVEVTGR